MRGNVVLPFSVSLLTVILAAGLSRAQVYDEIDELGGIEERERESLVNCIHDSTPRFGKRICDCGYRNEEYIAPKFEGSTTEIELANCKYLRIRRDTFSDLFQLTKLTVVNVENLILEQYSFDFTRNNPSARLKIHFVNDLIEEVPSHFITGPVADITFTRCRIGIFRPYSISNIHEQLEQLNLEENIINRLERHAFKRFDVGQFTIDGSKFLMAIPSQSFYEIEVINRFIISNNSFVALHPLAFVMKNVSDLMISNNEFNDMAGESFSMQIRNSVRIVGNYFVSIDNAVFKAITLDSSYYSRHSEQPSLLFHNNRIQRLDSETKSTYFSDDFNVQLRGIYVQQSIDCQQMLVLKQSNLLTQNQEEVFFGAISKSGEFNSFHDIRTRQCADDNFWLYLVIGATVASIVLALLALIIAFYCVAQKKKQRKKFDIVMPEPRTYRETQIIMQVENHGLLKTDL
ncbi:uncharacterized protein LOC129740124 [Uranotaenia lowii]|uniref:uncharacterized protein LOC129740124 n=1 Tax=Uranotaenia lowii TaxID=190385 RepID=UPI00247AF304|nr:uncharacterized protein LOC129740124 [Uranotaenia lowii]